MPRTPRTAASSASVSASACGPGQPGVGRLAGGRPAPRRSPARGSAVTAVARSPASVASRDRLVQDDGALLVAAADRVHERAAERGERAGLQRGVAVAGRGLGARRGAGTAIPASTAPATMAARPASSWLVTAAARPLSGSAIGEPADVRRLPQRPARPRCRARAAAGPRRPRPAAAPPARSPATARLRTSSSWLPSSSGLRATARGGVRRPPRPPGPPPAAPTAACRSRASTVAADPVPLDQQPRLEARAGRQRCSPSSSSPPRSSSALRVGRLAGEQRRRRRRRPAPRARPTGSPLSSPGSPERPAQLGQGPAQRAQRVVGVAEEQLGQVAAARRPLGQQQVAQQRPRLAPARRRGRRPVALDGRRTEQPDPHHDNRLSLAIILAHPATGDNTPDPRYPRVATTSRYSAGIATDGPSSWLCSRASAVRSS